MKSKAEGRPYAVGFNGHAKCCDCNTCSTFRANTFIEKWTQNGSAAEIDVHKTVFVRSHWRENPRHLTKFPNTKKRLDVLLRTLSRTGRVNRKVNYPRSGYATRPLGVGS